LLCCQPVACRLPSVPSRHRQSLAAGLQTPPAAAAACQGSRRPSPCLQPARSFAAAPRRTREGRWWGDHQTRRTPQPGTSCRSHRSVRGTGQSRSRLPWKLVHDRSRLQKTQVGHQSRLQMMRVGAQNRLAVTTHQMGWAVPACLRLNWTLQRGLLKHKYKQC
jgi:hypothetical protein